MAANTTSQHLTPPSTIGLMNSSERVRDELTPPTSSRQRGPPSPRTQSKSILTIALQKAQTAVQFDASNNVAAALDAYKQTVELLSQVIDKAANEADRRRLQLIHDTYADRIRLLSTIAPESDSSSDNNEDSEQNDNVSIQSSADSNINGNSRADLVERTSLLEYDSRTSLGKSSIIQDKEANSVEQGSSSENFNTKINNSHNNESTSESTLTEYNINDVKENIRSYISDYMTPQPKRLSALSQRSNTSTSTSKSMKSIVSDKTTPISIYEISVDGVKSIADSGESTPRSSDLDSEDSNTLNENSDANSENMEESSNYQNQGSSSQQNQVVGKPTKQKISINTSQLLPSPRIGSPVGNRVFVPPPPPKIAPPKSPPITSPTPNVLTERGSTSQIIVPPQSAISTQPAPPTSPHGTFSDTDDDKSSVNDDKASVNDDRASVKSVLSVLSRSSSPPPQSPVEKLIGKALPHGRRPAPLPLSQYNSRNVPSRSPSNPNIVVTQNNSASSPRRTASNPGNSHKKASSIRFFNSQQNSSTQTQSPWMNSFSVVSPPLGSPGLGPPTGTFRGETSPSKTNEMCYKACLWNPLPNTSFYDDDIIFPHMSSNKGLPEPPPNDVRLRPFWLMKLLEQTMTTGGYLTQKLFIPQHLWLQGHVKLTAIDTKISSCEVVSSCLERLEKIPFSDFDKLAKELEGIDPILEGLQNSLARKLNYVESTNGKSRQSTSSLMSWGSKLSRGLDRMGMGNAMVRTEEASGYVDVLLKVFNRADVVEKYIINYTSLKKVPHQHHHKQILVRLYKFSDFFGNVICRFVIRDLGILTDKYLKKGCNWIVD